MSTVAGAGVQPATDRVHDAPERRRDRRRGERRRRPVAARRRARAARRAAVQRHRPCGRTGTSGEWARSGSRSRRSRSRAARRSSSRRTTTRSEFRVDGEPSDAPVPAELARLGETVGDELLRRGEPDRRRLLGGQGHAALGRYPGSDGDRQPREGPARRRGPPHQAAPGAGRVHHLARAGVREALRRRAARARPRSSGSGSRTARASTTSSSRRSRPSAKPASAPRTSACSTCS